MIKARVHVKGLPYFPGTAVGRLHKGSVGDTAGRILLVSQPEVSGCSELAAGFIVVEAAPFSHTMIGLLGLGVPTVLISAEQAGRLEDGMRLMIDGALGLITSDSIAAKATETPSRDGNAGQAVLTTDGEQVNLRASVRRAPIARQAAALGAQAIGLVRSEYLFPEQGRVPDKSFYLTAFREICEAAAPLAVTFRLLDVAADKVPPWLADKSGVGQALGRQGVRIYNIEPVEAVINAQLDALAELAETFAIRLLLPFLVRLEEYDYWLHRVRSRLPATVPVGAMAETPAMMLDIGRLTDRADFVVIGCNDLMQGLFAADRDQPELRHYLDPYAPVLYRLFSRAAEQTGAYLDKVQLCGVLAQMQGVLPVLLGLGYRSFSVDAPFIPYLARRISATSKVDCEALASKVVAAGTTLEVLRHLQLATDRHVPFLR